jgi:hypothetical protein
VILYIVLVSAFFGWGLFNQKRERRRHPSSTEPLLNVTDDGEFDIDNLRKNEKLVAKVDLDYFHLISYYPVILSLSIACLLCSVFGFVLNVLMYLCLVCLMTIEHC